MKIPITKFKVASLVLMLWLGDGVRVSADDVRFLQVNLKDKSVSFALAEHPEITYSNDLLKISTASQSAEFSVMDITDFCFKDTATDILGISIPKAGLHEGLLFLSGLTAGALVEVRSLAAHLVLQAKASEDGQITIDMGNLSKGVYIVRTGNYSFKITNQ